MSTTATGQSAWYTDSLQQIDQALHASRLQFPLQIELGARRYLFAIWQGEQLPDQLIAYDTETAAIQGSELPQLALAALCGDQGSCYFVHADDLPRFISMHCQAYYVAHNAAFDFWVSAQALQSDPQALAAWWDLAGNGRPVCTMLLDSLMCLGRIDAEPIR